MARSLDFLLEWVRDHMNPTVHDDKPGAEYLADECLRDAKRAGMDEAALIDAAGGDLSGFMLSKLNIAVKKQADRVKGKSTRGVWANTGRSHHAVQPPQHGGSASGRGR